MALLLSLLLFSTAPPAYSMATMTTIHITPGDTLAKCFESSQRAPTNCLLTAGTHRPPDLSTTSSQHRLDITGTNNNTTLTGLTPLSGVTWKPYKHQIYQTILPPHLLTTEQVFIDQYTWISEARFPNVQGGGTEGVLDLHSWAFCGKGSHVGTCVDRKDKWSDLTKFNVSMKGALATLSLGGRYATYTRKVKTHRAGSAHFTYDKDLGPGPGSKNTGVGNRYWLQGKLDLLDAPGEWFIDTNASTLYVWMPDGTNPGDRVSVKSRSYCIDHAASSGGITLSNLKFLGCTFRLRNCNATTGNRCVVRDVNLTYPSYHRHVHLRDPVAPFTQGPPPNITLLQGDGSLVEHLSIRWSNSAGIKVVGSHNILQELLVEDTDWLATLDYPPVEIGFGMDQENKTVRVGMYPRNSMGINNTISKATVRRFGNAGIVTSQYSNTIQYSHVHHGGLLGSDDACIHADNSAARCGGGGGGGGSVGSTKCVKHWHNNWVHDCLAKCMRGDDNTQNLTMSNNVVFNCGLPVDDGSGQSFGVVLKGDGNAFYGNTIFQTKQNAVELATGAELKFRLKQSNINSVVFNNVAHTWSGHHGLDPLTKAAFKFGPLGQYTSGPVKQSYFSDPAAFDFTPSDGSPLIGIGVAYPPLVVAPSKHSPPLDAGAYQTGETPWRAGCTWSVQCNGKEDKDKEDKEEEDDCVASDRRMFQLQNIICVSLGGCPTANVSAAGDWPSQVTYFHDLLTFLIEPTTCLHTEQARQTATWLNNTDTSTPWWYTWDIFQVQYYDMPRLPNVRIESPATLGRKCWAFAFLTQTWLQQGPGGTNLKTQLQQTMQQAKLPVGGFVTAYMAAIDLTMPLCSRVMANCFLNTTYLPQKNNGTCPDKIGAFFTGFQWENGGGNGDVSRLRIDYVFPKYNLTKEFEHDVVFAVDVVLNQII